MTEAKKEIERLKNEAIEKAKSKLAEGESLPKDPETKFDDETKSQLKSMRETLSKLEKSAPELPSAMGVQEQKGSDVPIHVRGSHLALGKMVSRRFPAVLDPQSTTIEPEKSGRFELAQWLTRPEHPLTTRVLVNRIWRWHFGRGLVASTDNFGLLGEKPSHPELLDWLALQFQRQEWSIKSLHREIVLSSTYRQSSHIPAGGVPSASPRIADGLVAQPMPKFDSDNEWLSRFPIRRLEAEVIRDTILAVSGRLDQSTGRSLLHVKNREFLFDHTSIDKTKYDSPLRSVFLPVIRNNLYDLFQLFDYSDAAMVTGNRNSTIVSSQALFALNSAMMHESASQLAQQAWRDRRHRLADEALRSNSASLFNDLCRRLLGRAPSQSEVASAIALVESLEKSGDSPESAWGIVCHGLMASNEFIYVR